MSTQMEALRDEYALDAFFGDAPGLDDPLGLQPSDWTSNIDFTDGTWNIFSENIVDPALMPGTGALPLTGMVAQQPALFPDAPMQADAGSNLTNNLFNNPAEDPLIYNLWPNVTEKAFTPDLWDAPFTLDPAFSEPFPQQADHSIPHSSQSAEDNDEEPIKKKRRRIPPDAKKLLDGSFERHRENPYIPREEIAELASQTSLSVRQIRTYFANARARKLPPVFSPRTEASSQASSPMDIQKPEGAQQDPMERFLSSSPEDEGIPEEMVRKAAGSFSQPRSTSLPRDSNISDAISVSDSAFSSGSSSSAASIDSANSRGPRRGRKRQREPTQKMLASVIRKPSDPLKKYQCTFCTSDFAQKYDWRRHEESVHFPQKEWVCMPDGPIQNSRCVLCNRQKPDEKHLESHHCKSCSTAPRSQRTFLRKDKLIQHIGQVHVCPPPHDIKSWCRPVERAATLICGLCGKVMSDWGLRVDHVASHFSDGISMDMWLLNRPSGVVPLTAPTNASMKEFLEAKFNAAPTSDGKVKCETCALRFKNFSHAICHRRQVHNIYSENDRVALHHTERPSSTETPIPVVSELSGIEDLTKQTVGMQLFQHRQHGAKSGGTAPIKSHIERRPIASHSNHHIQGMLPFTPRVPIWPLSGVPTSRVGSGQSLVSNPHADWRKQLYEQGKNHIPVSIISPRGDGSAQRRRSNLSPSDEPAALLTSARAPAPTPSLIPSSLPPVPSGPIDELDTPPPAHRQARSILPKSNLSSRGTRTSTKLAPPLSASTLPSEQAHPTTG